jgi:hypothetical protein
MRPALLKFLFVVFPAAAIVVPVLYIAMSGLLAEKRHHREPGNFAAQVLVGRRPGSWIAEWMDRRVVRNCPCYS